MGTARQLIEISFNTVRQQRKKSWQVSFLCRTWISLPIANLESEMMRIRLPKPLAKLLKGTKNFRNAWSLSYTAKKLAESKHDTETDFQCCLFMSVAHSKIQENKIEFSFKKDKANENNKNIVKLFFVNFQHSSPKGYVNEKKWNIKWNINGNSRIECHGSGDFMKGRGVRKLRLIDGW